MLVVQIMSKQQDPFRVIKSLKGRNYYSLKALEENLEDTTLYGLPISIRIVLESVFEIVMALVSASKM